METGTSIEKSTIGKKIRKKIKQILLPSDSSLSAEDNPKKKIFEDLHKILKGRITSYRGQLGLTMLTDKEDAIDKGSWAQFVANFNSGPKTHALLKKNFERIRGVKQAVLDVNSCLSGPSKRHEEKIKSYLLGQIDGAMEELLLSSPEDQSAESNRMAVETEQNMDFLQKISPESAKRLQEKWKGHPQFALLFENSKPTTDVF